MFASQNGRSKITELLLKENAYPNACSYTGWTALLLACKYGHSSCCNAVAVSSKSTHSKS